jgi:hypothetical protein
LSERGVNDIKRSTVIDCTAICIAKASGNRDVIESERGATIYDKDTRRIIPADSNFVAAIDCDVRSESGKSATIQDNGTGTRKCDGAAAAILRGGDF